MNMEKYYQRKFKKELTAKDLKPKYAEKFINRVKATTEECQKRVKLDMGEKEKKEEQKEPNQEDNDESVWIRVWN